MGIVAFAILFFFTLVFLGSYLIFKKLNPQQAPTANIKFWLSIIILTPLVAIASLYAYLYLSSRYDDEKFDSTVWINQEDDRYKYVNDLITQDLLSGVDSAEVLNLLGAPDYKEGETFHYSIGYDPKQYFNMSPDWLIVEIRNNQVAAYHIER